MIRSCSITGALTASTTILLLNQLVVMSPTLVVLSLAAAAVALGSFNANMNLVVTTTEPDAILANTMSNAPRN